MKTYEGAISGERIPIQWEQGEPIPLLIAQGIVSLPPDGEPLSETSLEALRACSMAEEEQIEHALYSPLDVQLEREEQGLTGYDCPPVIHLS